MNFPKNKLFIILLILGLTIGFGLTHIVLSGGNGGNGNGSGNDCPAAFGPDGEFGGFDTSQGSSSNSNSDSGNYGNGGGWDFTFEPPPPPPPPPLPPPTVTLTANGRRPQIKIAEGWSVNLDWTSANVNLNGCTTSGGSPGWPGAGRPAQDQTPSYTYTPSFGIYTYTIQCTGPGGQSQPSSVIIDVVRPILTLERGSQTCLAVNLFWSWNDPFFNNEYSQYRVLRSEDGLVFSERAVVSAPTMTFQDKDTFISDQVFYYQIEALKSGFSSITSNTIETVPCPKLPTWEEIRPR